MATEDRLPWEKQRGESGMAWAAFVTYRDKPPGTRRVALVATELGKSESLMWRWNLAWNWKERVDAWDAEVDRQARQAHIDAVKEMRKRHAEIGNMLVTKGAQRLIGSSRDGVQAINLGTLSAADAVRLIEAGVRVERISRGEATEVIKGASDIEEIVREIAEDQNLSPEESALVKQFLMQKNERGQK